MAGRVLTPEQRLDRAMSETTLKKAVVFLAKAHGWKVFSLSMTGIKRPQRDTAGYPDLTLARRGLVLWMELKKEEADLYEAQEAWRRVLPDGFYAVVRPSDLRLGTVERWLKDNDI
jgi:hypothetical protein